MEVAYSSAAVECPFRKDQGRSTRSVINLEYASSFLIRRKPALTAMTEGGRVTCTVTDNGTTTGLANITVSLYGAVSGAFVRSATTTSQGNFTVSSLPTGTYVARTSNSFGFINELYASFFG